MTSSELGGFVGGIRIGEGSPPATVFYFGFLFFSKIGSKKRQNVEKRRGKNLNSSPYFSRPTPDYYSVYVESQAALNDLG